MSYERVKEYFDNNGLGGRVVVREHIGDTVEHAAEAIGCKPEHIVKTMFGHVPGAVCPFGIKEGVKVYLDVSLKRFEVVYTAGGSLNSTVKLTIPELEKHSAYETWIDVCKDWFVNEQRRKMR